MHLHNELQNKVIPQRQKQEPVTQPVNEDDDEASDHGRVSSRTRIGLAGSRRSPSPMVAVLFWIVRLY